MTYSHTEVQRFRKNFGKQATIMEPPPLLAVQCDSNKSFLAAQGEELSGLSKAFRSIFPIMGVTGTAELVYMEHELGQPPFDVTECRMRGLTYSSPLRVKIRLVIYDKESPVNNRTVKDIKEQEVFMGDSPLMTEHGSFVINVQSV